MKSLRFLLVMCPVIAHVFLKEPDYFFVPSKNICLTCGPVQQLDVNNNTSELFLHMKPDVPILSTHISRWFIEVNKLLNESSTVDSRELDQVNAHEVRVLSSFCVYFRHVSLRTSVKLGVGVRY